MPLPRGSKFSIWRKPSLFARSQSRFSTTVSPGGTGTPPTMTRVGFPSVCEATVCTTRAALSAIPSSSNWRPGNPLSPAKSQLRMRGHQANRN